MQTEGKVTKLAMKLLMPDCWQITATVEWSDPSEAPDGGDRVRERQREPELPLERKG